MLSKGKTLGSLSRPQNQLSRTYNLFCTLQEEEKAQEKRREKEARHGLIIDKEHLIEAWCMYRESHLKYAKPRNLKEALGDYLLTKIISAIKIKEYNNRQAGKATEELRSITKQLSKKLTANGKSILNNET